MITLEEYQLAVEQQRSDSILESLTPDEKRELLLAYTKKCSDDNATILVDYLNRRMAIRFNLL